MAPLSMESSSASMPSVVCMKLTGWTCMSTTGATGFIAGISILYGFESYFGALIKTIP